jgi:hypothetical protein
MYAHALDEFRETRKYPVRHIIIFFFSENIEFPLHVSACSL